MDGPMREDVDELQLAETPEDVAVLYSWANLKGAKYRDFSASRREYRAQMRHRTAELQREAELRAKTAAEAAAAEAERAAREAEEAARFHEGEARKASGERRRQDFDTQQTARDRAMQHATILSQRAASERVEAARRAEAVAAAEAAARREARELAEAQASAQRQAQRYAESEHMRRSLAGPQPDAYLPGPNSDPYEDEQPIEIPGRSFHRPVVSEEDLRPARLPRSRDPLSIVPGPPGSYAAPRWTNERGRRGYEHDVPEVDPLLDSDIGARAPASYSYEPNSQERVAAVDQYAHYAPYVEPSSPVSAPEPRGSRYAEAAAEAARRSEEHTRRPRGFQPDEESGVFSVPGAEEGGQSTPAWLYSQPAAAPGSEPARRRPPLAGAPAAAPDTLQESRERMASRWYALKGVFDADAPEAQAPPEAAGQPSDFNMPMLAVFSLAGGVGKTSLVATLGRALSASGESVLLADTTSHGLLPFYFGASELKAGVVRRFSPPPGSHDAPIALVSYETAGKDGDAAAGEWLVDELNGASRGMQRVLLDMSPASAWALRRLARLNALVIVPVSPDMNSVISLGAVEKFFSGISTGDGRTVQPFYLLNGYDASLPLHLDVREVMRQQLGERLLPFVIRRSPSVSEALAEGMTVMDYAPDAPVATDYVNLGSWLRTKSVPAATGLRNSRWSER